MPRDAEDKDDSRENDSTGPLRESDFELSPTKQVTTHSSSATSEQRTSDAVDIAAEQSASWAAHFAEDRRDPPMSTPAHIDRQKNTKKPGGPLDVNSPRQASSSAHAAAETPRTKLDAEHIKSYFLSNVKAVNPLREAQLRHMTPKPTKISSGTLTRTPRYSQSKPGSSEGASVSYAESSVSDVSSTKDLTVPAKFGVRANSSLPDTNGNDAGGSVGARVDAARLQGYLHKINIQLEQENVALKEEQDSLRRQFDRALLDNEKLRKQINSQSTSMSQRTSTTPIHSPNLGDRSHVQRLEQEVEQLRAGQDELNQMLDERDAEIETLQREHPSNDQRLDLQERIGELETELNEERSIAKQERLRFERLLEEARTEADDVLNSNESRFQKELARLRSEDDRLRNIAKGSGSGDEEDEAKKLRDALLWTESQLQDTNLQLDEALQQIDELQQVIQEAKDIQAELEQQAQDDKAAVEEVEEELAQAKDDLHQKQLEAEEAQDKVVDANILIEERNSDIIRLEMSLRQAQSSAETTRLKEKVTLLESQLEAAKQAKATPQPTPGTATPVHPSIAALRKPIETPKSPAELSSASWLYHESTLGEKAVLQDIKALRGQVDAAQAATDGVISQLSGAQLAEKIVEQQSHIDEMQQELAKKKEHETRLYKRLARLRCGNCKMRMSTTDLDMSKDLSVSVKTDESMLTKSTRSASQKEKVLADVANQLNELKTNWAIDRAKLEADRQVLDEERQEFNKKRVQLQDENLRLRQQKQAQNQGVRDQAKRMQENTLQDLSRARRIIGEFERELREDCDRFQQALRSSQGADQESGEIEAELQKTKVKLAKVDAGLKDKVAIFEKLELELYETSQLDTQLPLQIQHLEMEVRRFSADVERLREERNELLEQRQRLFVRRQKSQQEFVNVFEELRSAREAISAHQRQLDEQVETIETLHGNLQAQSKTLEAVHDDRDRLQGQRQEILDDVAQLEMDLRRVRDESRRFGMDLENMRREQIKCKTDAPPAGNEDVHRQYHTKISRLAADYALQHSSLAAQHRAQCKGLLLQIRYEKAKYMRESDLRTDLIQQKRYLLGIVGGLELSEQATQQFLTAVGSSKGISSDREVSGIARFKRIAQVVLATCRMQLMSKNWKQTRNVKQTLLKVHEASKAP